MSASLADYRVVSVLNKGIHGSCYCVEDRNTGQFYVWDVVDYSLLTHNGKALLLEEVNKLCQVNHKHLIKCVNYIDHGVTGTLYLVKEYVGGSVSALIRKCKSTNSFVDEAFIWKIIYQLGRACQAIFSRGPPSTHLDLTPAGVHLDNEGNAKLDYWLMFREVEVERRSHQEKESSSSRDGSESRHKNDTYSLGCLVHSIAALEPMKATKKPLKVASHYSKELKTIIDVMMSPDPDKRPTIEGILYHPSLLSQVVTCSLQQISSKDVELPTASEANTHPLGSCSKCKEFERKLTSIRNREVSTKAKESELRERERGVAQKEKHICILERLAKEKLSRAEVYLRQVKKGRSGVGPIFSEPPNDLDSSSYSADPGDTSILPTAAKLDPSRIIRPLSLAPSVSSRRSVRFETITEIEEPLRASNERMTWLQNKRDRYLAASKTAQKKGKENQEPPMEASQSSILSIGHNTKETQDGVLETFFR